MANHPNNTGQSPGKVPVSLSMSRKQSRRPEEPLGAATETKQAPSYSHSIPPEAKVGGSIGYTINVGNYESVRVDASATMPATVDDIASGKAHDGLYAILQEVIDVYQDRVREEFEKVRS